jgi:hypothetical protein
MVHKDSIMAAALADYQKGQQTTKEIAASFGVSQSTLTVWAKHAGLTLRTRGRRKLHAPTPKHRQIIKMAEVYTYEQVGKHFNMEKQAIHRIVKRWKDWMKPKKPMFEPGDIIQWRGQKLTVLSAGLRSGMVMDEGGKTMWEFPWNQNGKLPKKVGVNHKYVVHTATANGNADHADRIAHPLSDL